MGQQGGTSLSMACVQQVGNELPVAVSHGVDLLHDNTFDELQLSEAWILSQSSQDQVTHLFFVSVHLCNGKERPFSPFDVVIVEVEISLKIVFQGGAQRSVLIDCHTKSLVLLLQYDSLEVLVSDTSLSVTECSSDVMV